MVSLLQRVPFSNAKKEPKGFAPAYGTSLGLGVPSLRCPSGGIAYGLLRVDLLSMCAASPHGATRPPPDEHLRSACRRGKRSRAEARRPTGRPDRLGWALILPCRSQPCWRWSLTMTCPVWMIRVSGRFSRAGSLLQWDWWHRVEVCWLAGRHRWQASSHRSGVHLAGIGWL
jgi:hypothetical protein